MTEARGFMPVPWEPRWLRWSRTAVPQPSKELTELVKMGVDALPVLLNHVDDPRKTGMTVHGYVGEYYDGRYPTTAKEIFSARQKAPVDHTVRVGDMCYFVIGQIVNRDLQPIPAAFPLGTPMGGEMGPPEIHSPILTPNLAAHVRKDWSGLTKEQHIESLLADYHAVDYTMRPLEGLKRFAFYYPKESEAILTQMLDRQLIGWTGYTRVFDFVHKELLRNADSSKWAEMITMFSRSNPTLADYVPMLLRRRYLELRITLDKSNWPKKAKEVVDWQRNRDECQRALTILQTCFPKYNITSPPAGQSAEMFAQQGIVEALSNNLSPSLREACRNLFKRLDPDLPNADDRLQQDLLAIALMPKLAGHGHDNEYLPYFRKRVEFIEKRVDPSAQQYAQLPDLKEWMQRLASQPSTE